MELCSYATAAPTLVKLRPSLFNSSSPSSISLPSRPLLQTIRRFFFTSPKIFPFSLPSRQLKKNSSPFVASASTAVVDTTTDKLPADLKVTEIHEPNSRVRLSVEVPAIVCQDCYKRVINEFMKNSKVPGFRPGKTVPESILIGYIGKQSVQKATVESILKRTLPHAMSSVTGKALEDSIRIATKFSDMEKTYTSLKSLSYDVIVDVAPEIKWVPEDGYKNLKVVVQIDSEIDAQSASEQELKRRHKSLGSLRIVTDRGLQVKAGFSTIDGLESLPKPNLNLLCTSHFSPFFFKDCQMMVNLWLLYEAIVYKVQEYLEVLSSKLSSVLLVFPPHKSVFVEDLFCLIPEEQNSLS